jgi:TonB family protein
VKVYLSQVVRVAVAIAGKLLCMANHRARWVLIAALIATATLVRQGEGQTDVRAEEKALKGRQFELRSYSADAVAGYEWDGGRLVAGPVGLHTLGVLTPNSVRLKGGKILIEGLRSTIVRDSAKNSLGISGSSPMRVEIDLRGADPAIVLPQLEQQLFFSSARDAMDGLPAQLVEVLPGPAAGGPAKGCDCDWIFEDGQWTRLRAKDPTVTTPVLTHYVAPQFSEEARRQGASSSSTFVFRVTDTGLVEDIWLARAAGFGLDEKAEEALRQYVFKPAQHNGRAVGFEATVAVSFQMP